jgi:hypothetical protein
MILLLIFAVLSDWPTTVVVAVCTLATDWCVCVCVCVGRVDVWPFLILLEVIPAVCSLCILPFLPDTPRYLLLIKASRNAAMKGLSKYCLFHHN